jgi:16S rRNA (adenine1518-N6/adenine1519-N6)-dimethyltransferase
VANLPYNVAVPVLLRLLEHLPSLRTGLVMVQAEVADRLVAPARQPDVRHPVGEGRLVRRRAPGRLDRPDRLLAGPARRLGLVAFTRREPPAGDRLATFAVVDAAFAQRARRCAPRSPAGPARRRRREPAARRRHRPGARGEVLGVEDFARLAATP